MVTVINRSARTWLPTIMLSLLTGTILIWALVHFPADALLPSVFFLVAVLTLIGANIYLSSGFVLPTATALLDAGMLVLPIPAVILFNGLAALALCLRTRRPLERTLFNVANFVLPTLVALGVYHGLLRLLGDALSVPVTMLAVAIAFSTRFLVNAAVIHTKLAFEDDRALFAGLWRSIIDHIWASAILRLFALLIVLAYPLTGPWVLIPAVAFLLSQSHVIRFYAEREALLRAARIDGLTGINNRSMWEERAQNLPTPLPVNLLIVVDMDGLKQLNDTLGHLEGDRAICEMTERLCGAVGEKTHVYRYGGDELIALLPGLSLGDPVVDRATEALCAFGSRWAEQGVVVTASVGAASSPADGWTLKQLFEAADRRMYDAKRARMQLRAEKKA